MATTSTTAPTSCSPSGPLIGPNTPRSAAWPIVNATNSSPRCTSPFCPIKYPHDRGLYLHSCPMTSSIEARRIFVPSIPPPDVLAAYERCIRNDGTMSDVEMWVTFHEVHVEPLLEHMDAVWVVPVPTTSRDQSLKTSFRASQSATESVGGA